MTKKIVSALLLWIGVALVLVALQGLSHGATTAKHQNSLGVEQYYSNPYTYMFGSFAGGNYVHTKSRVGTLIVFQPAHTFELFTQEVLFCGDQGDEFRDLTGPIIVTYKTRAHEAVSGIGCHELVSIHHVQAEDLQ
jgi:hypothetical protein